MTTLRAALITLPALLLVACDGGSGDDKRDTTPDDTNNNQRTTATVEGEVTAEARGDAQVSDVVVYAVESDGSLRVIEESDAELGSDGSYSVDVYLDGTLEQDVLVSAWSGEEELGSVILSDTLTVDSTAYAGPIDHETSGESSLYLSLKADGKLWTDTDGSGSTETAALLRAIVDADLAGALWADARSGGDAAVDTTADAALSAMIAWESMLTGATVGGSDADVEALIAAMADAQAQLDKEAVMGDDDEAAMSAYLAAVASAYAEAGFSAQDAADAAQAAAAAGASFSAALKSSLSAELSESMAQLRAAEVTAAVEASLEAAGYSQAALDSAALASATLYAELEAAAASGSSAEADITEAWAAYSASIEATVRSELDVVLESTFSGLVELLADASATLQAEVDAAASTDADATAGAVVAAMDAYWASVAASGKADAFVDAGYTEAEASALVAMMGTLMITH